MATTRKIGKRLEELLEQQGDGVDGVKVSSGSGGSRFHVSAERSSEGINYLAGGPGALFLSLNLIKEKGHWKATNLHPNQRYKLLVNRMLNTSYQVLEESLRATDY